jgi:hypothetical protein
LRSIVVSPYWLGDPEVRICDSESHARFGIPATCPPIGRSLTTPLMRLRPLQGPTRHGPPTHGHSAAPRGHRAFPTSPKGCRGCRCWQLSWSFLPLRRLSPGESTPPRLASPGTFRPQGFTPSRRLPPRLNARPCFMPETSMGFFALQGFSLTARSTGSSPLDCPHDVSPPHQHIVDARRPSPHAEARFTDLFRLQGVAPTVNPYHHLAVTPLAMADPLLSFSASPGSYPTLTGHVACHACHSCASPYQKASSFDRRQARDLLRTAPSASHEQARVRPTSLSSVDHRNP